MVRNGLLVIFWLACGAIALHRAGADSRSHQTLRSFYVAQFYFSDYLPGWSEQILEVTPQGDDVHVRVIRISLANDFCPRVLVRAAEHVFPNTSVRKIAGLDICAFAPEGVNAALKAAAPKYAGDPSDSATQTIVAECGTKQEEFDFPYPAQVDHKVLEASNPEVSYLWDTNYRIFRRTFGKNFSFKGSTPEKEIEMEQLGTKLVPELISGKYQTAFAGSKCGDQDCDNYLAWRLRGYTEAPPPTDPSVVTLLEADSLHFTKFVSPVTPRMALLAHVSGDVRLRILTDPQTGLGTKVETISGHPLLEKAAMDAAQSWRFARESMSGQPLEVTLRFELKCP
jgi:hypothetical protein